MPHTRSTASQRKPHAADVVQAQQAQAEQHERKRRAVVESALAGEREAQRVAVLRRCAAARRRPAPDRWAPAIAPSTSAMPARQPEQPDPGRGDARDGQHHRDGGEPQGQAPAPVADRHAQLDADGEQRDQQRDLGDGLEQRELAHADAARARRTPPARARSRPEVDHRGAHRQPVEESPEQRDRDQQYADEQKPECAHRLETAAARRRRAKNRRQRCRRMPSALSAVRARHRRTPCPRSRDPQVTVCS